MSETSKRKSNEARKRNREKGSIPDRGNPEGYWDSVQIAAFLGTALSTISRFSVQGRFPDHDMFLNRRKLWKIETVMNWKEKVCL